MATAYGSTVRWAKARNAQVNSVIEDVVFTSQVGVFSLAVTAWQLAVCQFCTHPACAGRVGRLAGAAHIYIRAGGIKEKKFRGAQLYSFFNLHLYRDL